MFVGVGTAVFVAVSVGVAVLVAVLVGVGVSVGVLVAVSVGVGVLVAVSVGVGVLVAVAVSVGVGVLVAVAVSVGVGVIVAVLVGVAVLVAVSVGVTVLVAVLVGVGVLVAVALAVGVLLAVGVGDGAVLKTEPSRQPAPGCTSTGLQLASTAPLASDSRELKKISCDRPSPVIVNGIVAIFTVPDGPLAALGLKQLMNASPVAGFPSALMELSGRRPVGGGSEQLKLLDATSGLAGVEALSHDRSYVNVKLNAFRPPFAIGISCA